jgi:aminopeptidase N
MSTYIVAFVVYNFRFVETTQDNNVKFRIWSEPYSLDQASYPNKIGPKMKAFFKAILMLSSPSQSKT